MNKSEYMNDLKRRLRRLPDAEITSVMMYYEEYFEESGDEQKTMDELGTPAEVASHIIGEFTLKDSDDGTAKPAKKSLNTIWIALLAVFASPIALPIAVAFAIVIFAMLITVFALYFTLGIVGITMLVAGIGIFAVSFLAISYGIGTVLFGLGAGLFLIGIGIPLTMSMVSLTRVTFNGIARLIGKRLAKKSKSDGGIMNENI